jgi:hypothetical protein
MPIKKETTMSDLNAGSAVADDPRAQKTGRSLFDSVTVAQPSIQHVIDYGQYRHNGHDIDPKLFGVTADSPILKTIDQLTYGGEPLTFIKPSKVVRSTKPEQIIINPDYKDEVIVDMSHGHLEKPASRRLIRLSKGVIKHCFVANDGSAIDYDELEWRDL